LKFLLDHDVPADLAVALRTVGHEVVRLVEVLSANVEDNEVWAHACDHRRILITCNRDDFLTLAKATEIHPGLIILGAPPADQSLQSEARNVVASLAPRPSQRGQAVADMTLS
jgi:predicted nuclease of predicted toxin-antitoxin system